MNTSTTCGFSKQRLACAILGVSACVSAAFGQLGNATAVGRVQDSQGGVIVGARVELKRLSTNEVFRTVTTASGDYSIVNLPIDTYEFKSSSAGFKTEVRSGVKLEVGATVRVDFDLAVGAVTESVKVEAQSPILRTDTSGLGQVIDNSQITGVPLNSRDVLGTLGGLTPGLPPAAEIPPAAAPISMCAAPASRTMSSSLTEHTSPTATPA